MVGSSTVELRLRPTREDELDYVVAAEADNAPFLAPSPREMHLGFLRDPRQRHLIAEAGGRPVGFVLLLRDALFYGGRFESLVVMSILRPEWSP